MGQGNRPWYIGRNVKRPHNGDAEDGRTMFLWLYTVILRWALLPGAFSFQIFTCILGEQCSYCHATFGDGWLRMGRKESPKNKHLKSWRLQRGFTAVIGIDNLLFTTAAQPDPITVWRTVVLRSNPLPAQARSLFKAQRFRDASPK